MTPSFFPLISQPAKALLFSVRPAMFSSSALLRYLDAPDQIPGGDQHARDHHLLHAVGIRSRVLNTTMPSWAQASAGMLLTPAPALATGQQTLRQLHFMHIRAAPECRQPPPLSISIVLRAGGVCFPRRLFRQWIFS